MFIMLFHSTHDLHQLKKRSSPRGKSDDLGIIFQYYHDNIILCVRVASCRPAFLRPYGAAPVPLPSFRLLVNTQHRNPYTLYLDKLMSCVTFRIYELYMGHPCKSHETRSKFDSQHIQHVTLNYWNLINHGKRLWIGCGK